MGELLAYGDKVVGSPVADRPTEVTWLDWVAMTAEQKAGKHWLITDVPGAEGTVEIENMHLAWTNPNPNTTFANQQVTLNTDGNYSRIKVKCKIFYTDTSFFWREFKKGDNNYIEVDDINNLRCARRAFNYMSDNKWQFGSGVIRDMYSSSGQAADDGRYIIPIEIYTYNDTLTARITALAESVSTRADHCMMSDGETSVEDALGMGGSWSFVGQTSQIAVGNTGVMSIESTYPSIDKALQLCIVGSYNQAFQYASCNIVPYITGVNFRVTHNINSASTGSIQFNIVNSRQINFYNQINEAQIYRLYVKYPPTMSWT